MPFAVLGILFVLGSAWSHLPELRALLGAGQAASGQSAARAAAHDQLVAARVTDFCRARLDEEIEAMEEERRLCPRFVETTATTYRVELAYQGPSREYRVQVRSLYPAREHDWTDERGTALREPAFRFSKAVGSRLVEISGLEPAEERRVEFLHRFVAVSEQCLDEGERLAGLSDAELAASGVN